MTKDERNSCTSIIDIDNAGDGNPINKAAREAFKSFAEGKKHQIIFLAKADAEYLESNFMMWHIDLTMRFTISFGVIMRHSAFDIEAVKEMEALEQEDPNWKELLALYIDIRENHQFAKDDERAEILSRFRRSESLVLPKIKEIKDRVRQRHNVPSDKAYQITIVELNFNSFCIPANEKGELFFS